MVERITKVTTKTTIQDSEDYEGESRQANTAAQTILRSWGKNQQDDGIPSRL